MIIRELIMEEAKGIKLYKVDLYRIKKDIENSIKKIKVVEMPELKTGEEEKGFKLAAKERRLNKLLSKVEQIIKFIDEELIND